MSDVKAGACLACGHSAVRLGEIPFSYHFLQHRFSTPLDTGDLYDCHICGLRFKDAFVPEDALREYYESAPDTLNWGSDTKRPDFIAVSEFLVKQIPTEGCVLDVGCYTGQFLCLLPDVFSKYGIEASRTAAQRAAQRKITILGPDIDALGENAIRFHAITLLDVFEHLTKPLVVLDALFSRLRPGGLLCIVTGNADHLLFRLIGPKYYYVCMPEHVCFLTRKFASYFAARHRATYSCLPLERFRPDKRACLREALVDIVNTPTLLLKSKRRIHKCYWSAGLRQLSSFGMAPICPTNDHVLAVFRKPDALT